MLKPRLYDYAASPNCLKVRMIMYHLGVEFERVPIDIFGGDTLTEEFAALNPAREVPVLQIGPSTHLVESAAMLWHFAEGTRYLPATGAGRARVVRWLVFEQQAVMNGIAGLRLRLHLGVFAEGDEAVKQRRAVGRQALDILETSLAERPFLAGDRYSIADLANYAYVHVAGEAGYELGDWPSVSHWIERVEAQPGFHNDLEPLPPGLRADQGRSIYG